ncbi:MAG: hypothetical protein EOP06_20405 [Proteobacteria bacterium]|nr:MAG: hypothetical protein EOP06_20405 [Pseudomonadota bacterium]
MAIESTYLSNAVPGPYRKESITMCSVPCSGHSLSHLNSANFADPVDGYAKYIDVDSFINMYFVNELLKNKDAANFSSIYLYKDKNQKLKMGPAWDFDLVAGNSDINEINDPEGWHLKTRSPWFARLFQDPAFVAKVKAKWNSVKAQKIDTMDSYIDQMAYRIELSQQKNFVVWDIMNTQFWNIPLRGSHSAEVAAMKQWLKLRAAWMDQQIQNGL